MKTYKAIKRISNKLREVIVNTIETNERYSGCYFWTNTGNASSRRSQEARFAGENPEYSVETKKGLIIVKPELSISCANYYYSLSITRDGEKSNITILKNLIK